jgi:hypothetical protein
MRKLLLTSLIALGAPLVILPSIVLAGGPTVPSDPPLPPLHRHYIVSPDGSTHEVGPDRCGKQDSVAIQLAFYNFHYNVHLNPQNADIRGNPGCGPIPASVTP